MSVKKAEAARKAHEPAGDCVDCFQCVNVCPTGVDIRDGSQLGCIQCGLCIDACDNVMAKLGRPGGLIAYDTDDNAERRERHEEPVYRIIRVRTVIYAVLIALVSAVMLYALTQRETVGISALHDRNPLFVRLADGGIRNAYTIRVSNKAFDTRPFRLEILGLKEPKFEVIGVPQTAATSTLLEVGPDQTRELRVLVTLPKDLIRGDKADVSFRLTDIVDGASATVRDHFFAPEGDYSKKDGHHGD